MLAERFKTLFYFTINKSFVFVIDFVGRLHPKYFEEDTFSELSQTSLVISNNTLIIKLSASILHLIVIKCIFFKWEYSSYRSILSYNCILFKNVQLYIWPLIYIFVLGRGRFFTVYIYFKETFFFNFSYKLFNKYFSLLHRAHVANLGCQ